MRNSCAGYKRANREFWPYSPTRDLHSNPRSEAKAQGARVRHQSRAREPRMFHDFPIVLQAFLFVQWFSVDFAWFNVFAWFATIFSDCCMSLLWLFFKDLHVVLCIVNDLLWPINVFKHFHSKSMIVEGFKNFLWFYYESPMKISPRSSKSHEFEQWSLPWSSLD